MSAGFRVVGGDGQAGAAVHADRLIEVVRPDAVFRRDLKVELEALLHRVSDGELRLRRHHAAQKKGAAMVVGAFQRNKVTREPTGAARLAGKEDLVLIDVVFLKKLRLNQAVEVI